jgi:AcrR family transcriptional regulator
MSRSALYHTDQLLDAARDLIVERGPRAAGIRAIAERSGAPSGTLYHRFGSRDDLVAQVWLRAVRRFQSGFLTALDADDPTEGVVQAVRWSVSFALGHPADAQLLLQHSQRDLLDAEPAGELAVALAAANEPLLRRVRVLAGRLYGTTRAAALERVRYAVIDLPLAVLTRHLRAGTLTRATAETLAAAARALLSDATETLGANRRREARERAR